MYLSCTINYKMDCLFQSPLFQQKARDNRAALRINKVQMSNDTLKRHQHPQQQQQLLTDTFDPNSVPLDTELLFKDSLKPKESEHEQEWKFRQVRVPLEG